MAINRNFSSHSHILECMQVLGYETSDNGVCSGIACMSIRSYLYGDEGITKFRERLKLISAFSPKDLKTKIENAKKRLAENSTRKPNKKFYKKDKSEIEDEENELDIANNNQLSLFKSKQLQQKIALDEDLALINILEFFEGVHLYSEPYMYPYLFDKKTYELHQMLLVSPLIKSPELFPDDPVVRADSNIGGYTRLQLEEYFMLLLPVLELSKSNVSMFIESCGHAINITYDPEHHVWRVLNANQMEIDSFDKNDLEGVANFVWTAFGRSEYSLFSTDFFTRESEKEFSENFKTLKGTEAWKKLHNLSDQLKMFDKQQSSILHVAAKQGDLETIKQCLEGNNAIDLNKQNSNGATLLIQAIAYGHVGLAQYLIEHGADTALALKPNNSTTLHQVCTIGMAEMVDVLLQKNKKLINQVDEEGMTPLHIAAYFGNTEVVKKLLENNALLDVYSNSGVNAIHLAAARGHVDILKLLIQKGVSIGKTDLYGGSPLHAAAESGQIQTVKYLIENKAGINNTDKEGVTALQFAVLHNHIEVAKLLIATGATVNFYSKKYGPLLHAAIRNKNIEMVKLLIDAKANVYEVDKANNSAVHIAAELGNIEILSVLLAKSADVNALNQNRKSPLLIAAEKNHVECVKELLINGKGRIQFDSTLSETAKAVKPPMCDILLRYQQMKVLKEPDVNSMRYQAIMTFYQKGWDAANDKEFAETLKQFIEFDARINSLKKDSHLSSSDVQLAYQKYSAGEDYISFLKSFHTHTDKLTQKK